MNPSYFLVYASTAVREFSEEELLTLLEEARRFNADQGITGILLYLPLTFVQVLEGRQDILQSLYEKITRDPRHKNCEVIVQGARLCRKFSSWTMAFRNLSGLTPQEVPGFSAVLDKPLTWSELLAERDPLLRLVYSFAVPADGLEEFPKAL
ncbi:MAG: BLUF domain-containing protein [Spirochaetales bacterium]|nr:BLUF domain-containing protein [Spirochaetales bacterium]